MLGNANTPQWLRSWMYVRWKRMTLLMSLVLVIVFIAFATAWFFKPWSAAHEAAKSDPHLGAIPVDLPDTTLATLKPNRIRRFDATFQAPWDGIEVEKDGPDFALILFKNGPSAMFYQPVSATAPSRMQTRGVNEARLATLFPQRTLASGYEWEKAILNATPDQIAWWNRVQNKRMSVLLEIKSAEQANSAITYNISNRDLRGFQFGDPASPPESGIRLKLYDAGNRVYEFSVSPRKGSRPPTQPELNAFVSSLRPVP